MADLIIATLLILCEQKSGGGTLLQSRNKSK
jgi:hypothetical protein